MLKRHFSAFAVALITVISAIICYQNYGDLITLNFGVEKNCDFNEAMASYRRCLVNFSNHVSIWHELPKATTTCLDKNLRRKLDVRSLHNDADEKLIILPSANESNAFLEVTLGVGNNILAEEKLRNLVPRCKFFGADPILESGKAFQAVGTYFQVAVAADSGFLNASVLENGLYHNQLVPTITLADFLKKYVKTNITDYMIMDNEGAEYEIFEKYLIDNSLDSTICQIAVEMHGPFRNYGTDKKSVNRILTAMLRRSHFLPIWSEDTNYGHMLAFYINVEHPYCVKRFYLEKVCN